jgi:ABC-type phosphonate transport system ATPase subunit
VQAKRTNIGIALITHPRVLFLDEPTSGLDSYTAHEVTCTAPCCDPINVNVSQALPNPLLSL